MAHHMPARGNEPRRVAANRELIERFEKKFQATLARIWGEAESP
jgi:type I restriction enzyme M protein